MIRRTAALVAGVSLAGGLLFPASAHAASLPPLGKTTWTKAYSVGYCSSSKLHRGLVVTLHGKMRYYRRVFMVNAGKGGSFRVIKFGDPTLLNPVMELKTVDNCKHRKAAGVSRVTINQLWYDWGCSTTVRLILGRGSRFGISLSGTRKCGRTKVANRATPYGKGSHYNQQNSGAPIGWDWEKKISQGGKICLHADAGVIAYIGNNSDTVNRPLSVCVPASYKAKP